MQQPLFEIKKEASKKEANYAKFMIAPLEAGYGHTLGTTLRRILLSSLRGAAITTAQVSGVKHQFSTLKGLKEDVVEFLLNLKQVRLAYSGSEPVKLTLSAKGEGVVTAGDIKTPASVKIVNPELVLASLAKDGKLEAKMEAELGVGYSVSEERKTNKIGVIPLDALFSPVTKVNYEVEETRVGRKTNFDKLVLEIWTDGTVAPQEALVEAARIAVAYFNQIVSPKKEAVKEVEKVDSFGAIGKLSVEEINLPTRVANALAKAGYDTVEKLAQAKKEDLVKVRNLGEKSLKIIRIALMEKGVQIGE
jgi:DNA-directed RNA polymerase subunit alpha